MKQFKKRKIKFSIKAFLSLCIIIALCITFTSLFLIFNGGKKYESDDVKRILGRQLNDAKIKEYGDEIIRKCKDEEIRRPCYDKYVPSLIPKVTLQDAFAVTEYIISKDSTFYYCHITAHDIAGKIVRENPELWDEVIRYCPADMCSNGCAHASFMEHFENYTDLTEEQLKETIKVLNTLCEKNDEWQPAPYSQTSCHHGLGHTAMYVTNANIEKAIEICKQVAYKGPWPRDYTQTCYEGIFMQLYQPQNADDVALIRFVKPNGDPESVKKFCNEFTGEPRAACWREAWVLYKESFTDPAFMVNYCQPFDSEQDLFDKCIDKMIYAVMTLKEIDVDFMLNYCLEIDLEYAPQCYRSTAGRMMTVDQNLFDEAIEVCRQANARNASDACYSTVVHHSNYIFESGSKEAMEVCSKLPSQWKQICLDRQEQGFTSYPIGNEKQN